MQSSQSLDQGPDIGNRDWGKGGNGGPLGRVHSIVHVEDHVHVLACTAPSDLLNIFYYL